MTATKLTAPVRSFLKAVQAGRSTQPTNATITAALAGGWVEYREGERVRRVSGVWVTVGQGYFLTDAGRAVLNG